MSHRTLTPDEIIMSLRLSLARANQITAILHSKHPEIYQSIVEQLPPPPGPAEVAVSVDMGVVLTDSESKGGEGESKGGNDPASLDGTENSDFTPEPKHTEESAGAMFADSRNMERDRFFKARIGAGIDDSKVVDTTEKVNCKNVVNAAKGYLGMVDVMRMYPEEEGVQRRALKELLEPTTESAARDALGKIGAVSTVVAALENFGKTSPGVAHFGIRVLSNLAFSHDDNRAVIGVTALDAVLQVMSTHIEIVDLQKDGCGCLTNVAHGNDVNKRSIANKGGGEVILNAMERFLGDARVQRAACWAILTIGGDEASARRVASDGAVGALLAAMVNFEQDANIQHFGTWGLLNISLGSDALAKFVVDNQALAIVQKAVINHGQEGSIVEKAGQLNRTCDKFIKKEEL
jgi:hypothetical protein